MTRSESRELGFVLIFEQLFSDYSIKDIIAYAEEFRGYTFSDFSIELATKSSENLEIIDSNIEKYLKGWSKNRISKVALSILRLAFTELLFIDDIPESVTINEAVELAKKYGTDDDPAFVNGILGSYSRDNKKEVK